MKKSVKTLAFCVALFIVATLIFSCSGKNGGMKISGTFVSQTDENGKYTKYVFTADKYTRYNVENGMQKQNLTGSYTISDGKIVLKNGGGGPPETLSFSKDGDTLTINGVVYTKQ